MELTTILGVIAGVVAVVGAMIFKHINFAVLLNPAAFFVIIVGTIATILNSFPAKNLKSLGSLFKILFNQKKQQSEAEVIDLIYNLSKQARSEGLLSLEAKVEQIEDPFLKKGVRLLVDGTGAELIEEILETEIAAMEKRHEVNASIFSSAGMYAPTLGVLGAVFGLIAAMSHINDTDQMAEAISAAFIATILGIFTGYVLWHPFANKLNTSELSESEIGNELLRLLRQSIQDRMMSDVPFGVFLSGGVDSSVNVALMHELMTRQIDTYTVGFKDLEKYNELQYARKIAGIYHTNHHEILIDQDDAFPILEDLPWYEDEPNGDPVCIPLFFLSKLTRQSGTIVVQVGEGSDEEFVGYASRLRDYNFHNSYWKLYKSLPSFIKQAKFKIAKPLLLGINQLEVLDYLRRGTYGEHLYWGGDSIFSPIYQELMFSKQFQQLKNIPADFADSIHNQALALFPEADYLQRNLYYDITERLSEMLLMRVDKIGMANSIEARVPFLDHRIVEFSMNLSPEQKVPNKRISKYILKKAVESILPNDIINRKKQGFWAPVNEWLGNEWYDYAYSKIIDSRLMKEGIFDKNYIINIFEKHKQSKQNHGKRMFSLLMLFLWHERFFN